MLFKKKTRLPPKKPLKNSTSSLKENTRTSTFKPPSQE